jgi:hypothetical protein
VPCPRSRDSRPRLAHRALTCAILGCPAILAPAIPSIGALAFLPSRVRRWRRSPHPTGAASPYFSCLRATAEEECPYHEHDYLSLPRRYKEGVSPTSPASARRPRRSARTTGTTTPPSLDAIRRASTGLCAMPPLPRLSPSHRSPSSDGRHSRMPRYPRPCPHYPFHQRPIHASRPIRAAAGTMGFVDLATP